MVRILENISFIKINDLTFYVIKPIKNTLTFHANFSLHAKSHIVATRIKSKAYNYTSKETFIDSAAKERN